jgi:hypothetical protein
MTEEQRKYYQTLKRLDTLKSKNELPRRPKVKITQAIKN